MAVDQQRRSEDFLETVDSQNNTLLSANDYQSFVKALKGENTIWATISHGKRITRHRYQLLDYLALGLKEVSCVTAKRSISLKSSSLFLLGKYISFIKLMS